MDKLRQFQNLIEINSLDKKIHGHMQKIEEELKRISFLEEEREKKKLKLAEITDQIKLLNEENSTLEKELFEKSKNLAKAKEHLSMATSQKQLDSLEKEISQSEPIVSSLEDKGLEILQEIEDLETEANETDVFLSGSKQSLEEIKNEVCTIQKNEDEQIKIHENRIEELFSDCTNSYKEAFISVRGKYRFDSPLTFMQNRSCNECKFAIDEGARDNVDRHYNLEFCPGCGRLICPLAATTA